MVTSYAIFRKANLFHDKSSICGVVMNFNYSSASRFVNTRAGYVVMVN
jgi:hypothetical protein